MQIADEWPMKTLGAPDCRCYFSMDGGARKAPLDSSRPTSSHAQFADFVVTGCHAAFFTSYSVELGFFRSPVSVNAIVPVMPS